MKPVIVVAAAGLSLLCPWTAALKGVEALPPAPPPLDPATSMDKSVQPGDDFYHYADGGWLKNNPIPSDHTSWGSFNILTEHNNDVLHVHPRRLRRDRWERAARCGGIGPQDGR